MAAQLEADTPLAKAMQKTIQRQLLKLGWATEENDETLAEYITMMVVNGKTQEEFAPELGTDLLNTTPDDPAVVEFAGWLFTELAWQRMGHTSVNSGPVAWDTKTESAQVQHGASDAVMNDVVVQGTVTNPPSGPKAMRNGATRPTAPGSVRDRRMFGDLNRQLDRSKDTPDMLKIKGAASGGRIEKNSAPPRGPRSQTRQQNVVNGVQRVMNGRPTAAQMNGMGMPPMPSPIGMTNPTMPMNMPMNMPMTMPTNPQEQEQFYAMVGQTMAFAMMQAQQNSGQMPSPGFMNPAFQQNTPPPNRSLFDRVDRRQKRDFNKPQPPRQPGQNADAEMQDSAMAPEEMNTINPDGSKKAPFDTLCRFNNRCTNVECTFAHQAPIAPPGTPVDLTDTCSFGIACENRKCAGKHPSPAIRKPHAAQQHSQQINAVDCKFYPNCTNLRCPFRHPDMPPCRNGADCKVANCKFSHSHIVCRYNPCLNAKCAYKHADGQKRGQFEDKVWKPEAGNEEGFDRKGAMKKDAEHKSERFAELKAGEGMEEELVLPGSGNSEMGRQEKSDGAEGGSSSQMQSQVEKQITV